MKRDLSTIDFGAISQVWDKIGLKNMITYKDSVSGGAYGRYGKYYISIYLRPMGHYTAVITINGGVFASEGVFSSYLKTLDEAKEWVTSQLGKAQRRTEV